MADNANFINNLDQQIEAGRFPVIDTRNASQAAIDDLRREVIAKGWSESVLWYP